MGYFHLKLVSPRPTFPFDMTEVERVAMTAHAQYWRRLTAERLAVAVGPVFDPKGPWGMALVETENETEAEALGAVDPIFEAALGFRWEVVPMPSLILREPTD
jgi:hypothetical protein